MEPWASTTVPVLPVLRLVTVKSPPMLPAVNYLEISVARVRKVWVLCPAPEVSDS